MYADDTVILANSSIDLQRGLDALEAYSNKWKLKVNCSKTKVVIFGSRSTDTEEFTLYGNTIEIVRDFK